MSYVMQYYFGFIVICIGLAISLQCLIPLNWDALYLLQAGERLSAGGSLLHDVFDPNPPLILYFSVLINQLAQTLGLPALAVLYLIQYACIA